MRCAISPLLDDRFCTQLNPLLLHIHNKSVCI